MNTVTALQLTVFTKGDGPLTKRIALAEDGSRKSDGSACFMSIGTARRFNFDDVRQFAELIEHVGPHEAIALGRLRLDLPDRVDVTTKRILNGAPRPNCIARTHDYLSYRAGKPALALVDYDTKGMPPAVAAKIEELGGCWAALVWVLPALANVARVERKSTSAGLYRADTGERLSGSGGEHVYLAVQDGSDVERFLKTLHARCSIAGLGWLMVGAGGQLLERSIVDRVVGSPERLVFEGPPVLGPPLAQDGDSRRPIATKGETLDTVSACPPLSILEQGRLRELRAREAHHLAPDIANARMTFIDRQSRRLVEHGGIDLRHARKVVERRCEGILLPDVVLPFDEEELVGKTVGHVLADPAHFEGATLADPLEGVEYGACKAKIMLRADGTPWIHSFAHGRTIYELKLDYKAAAAALKKAPAGEAVEVFVRCALAGYLDESEVEQLKDAASRIAGVGKRPLEAMLKRGRQARAAQQAQHERDRRMAERKDPRPQIPLPTPDAEWLPQMQAINDVLGTAPDAEPPTRDFEGFIVRCRTRPVSGLHALSSRGSNHENIAEPPLPATEQLLLTRFDEAELAELIERYIEYVDAKGMPVHLQHPFVKHYLKRDDGVLPVVTSIAQLPIVLPDGTILNGRGLNRQHSIIFRVPEELDALLPSHSDCTSASVGKALRFLTDEWLCDVATDYRGKCSIVACALTIIERAILSMRPAFFFGAGKRGGGKTTTINMIASAVLGVTAAAAAWSPNEEERRKALFSYFLEGVPFLVWDNLQRGTTVSCPSIEKALTAELYTDRLLGVSEHKLVPINTIQAFTGNNIAPRGDMSSRSLQIFISVDRPDPENREFKHPEPIGWTKANRGKILAALYTILLGNPRRSQRRSELTPSPTRFKEWWDLVGSAIEFAAEQHTKLIENEVKWFIADPHPTCPATRISFKAMFLEGETDDEETTGLAALLTMIRIKWWDKDFKASDVASYIEPENAPPEDTAREMRAALERAAGKTFRAVSPATVTWCLKKLTNAPVETRDGVLVLTRRSDRKHGDIFRAEKVRCSNWGD